MYTIAICDSSRSYADTLRISIHNVLDRLRIAHIIYYYKDSQALYKMLKKYPEKYNFLFLETALHPMDGLELGKKLRSDQYEGHIAYISQSLDNACDGYDVGACQYFIKPVNEDKLYQLFFRLSNQDLQRQSDQYLLLNYGTTYYKLRYSDLLYIETAGRKVAIHTKDQDIVYPCKLSEMEKMLPTDSFLRCHQSFILQVHAVKSISKSLAILLDGTEIPISRTYKETITTFFSN